MSGENRITFTWNGVVYRSLKEAARCLGVSEASIRYWRKKGWCKDSDRFPLSVTWNGIKYPTVYEAARAHGVNPTTMLYMLHRGNTGNAQWKRPVSRKTACTWNGKKYASIKDAAEDNHITPHGMRYRLIRGYKCDDDLTQ